ncbi:MAG: type II secretion system protein [bacterium]|nr:type II secretion system protein [bacterium]
MTGESGKRGFTIVEMLMVIGVLAVLMGIVTTAATAAIRQARDRRTAAMKQVIQAGISTYYAQKNYWPPKGGQLQSWADNGLSTGKHVDFLSADQYDTMMRELAKVSVGSKATSPVMDFNGCTVTTRTAASRRNGRGKSFADAVKKRGSNTIKLADMVFGYLTKEQGYFRRYIVQYNADSDAVTVMTENDYKSWWGVTHSGSACQLPSGY